MGRQREVVRLAHPRGGSLVGDFADAGRTWAVVFLHGLGSIRNGAKAASLEEACARRGWTFAAFDLRGHGESSGTMLDLTCDGIFEDLDVIERFLRQRGVDTICPVGSSMGGWIAAWWSQRLDERVPGCVLLAPAWHFPHGIWQRLIPAEQQNFKMTGKLRLVNDWLDAEISYRLIEGGAAFPLETLLTSWSKPALIFHGLFDDVVACQSTWEVIQRLPAAAVEVRLFKQGDHRLVAYKDEIAEEACRLFARLLGVD